MNLRIKVLTLVVSTEGETVSFRAVWKKTNYEITFAATERIAKLKQHIQGLTGVENALRCGDTVAIRDFSVLYISRNPARYDEADVQR